MLYPCCWLAVPVGVTMLLYMCYESSVSLLDLYTELSLGWSQPAVLNENLATRDA